MAFIPSVDDGCFVDEKAQLLIMATSLTRFAQLRASAARAGFTLHEAAGDAPPANSRVRGDWMVYNALQCFSTFKK